MAHMNRVTLFLAHDDQTGTVVWMARFNGPISGDIIRLFGTNCIPTAFTAAMPVNEVLDYIAQANPECLVTVQAQ